MDNHEPIISSAASWLRDAREIQQRLAAHAAKDIDHAYYRWLAEQLLEKLHGAHGALEAGVYTRSLNREPLEGMLVLGDIESTDAAPVLSFNEFEARRAA